MSFFPTEKTKAKEESIYFNIYHLKTKIWHIFIKRRKFVTTGDSAKVEKKAHNWDLQENKVSNAP